MKSKHEHEGELASEQCLGAGLPAASWDQVCQSWGSCPATRKLEPNVWPKLMLMKTVGLGLCASFPYTSQETSCLVFA